MFKITYLVLFLLSMTTAINGMAPEAAGERKSVAAATEAKADLKTDTERFRAAVISGNISRVAAMLEGDFNPNMPLDEHNTRGLHLAVERKDCAMVQLLVEHGAEHDAENHFKITPYDVAQTLQDKTFLKFFRGLFKPYQRRASI